MAPTTPNAPRIVLGVANIGDSSVNPHITIDKPEDVDAFLAEFYNRGYRELDSARSYPPQAPGTSEPRVGLANKDGRFIIDTKVLSFRPGDHATDKIATSIDGSLAALGTNQVNIEYLHVPERSTPFAETLAAMDAHHRAGKFRKLGISNYEPAEVTELLNIARDKGYNPPQVFQGCYNPVSRDLETVLLPLLRANNIAFYAYSPTAGGLFNEKQREGGRFEMSVLGPLYTSKYRKPGIAAAVGRVQAVAKKHGITAHAASLRWTVYHGALSAEHGDAVIIGASTTEQLKSNLDAIDEGPLPQAVVDVLDGIADSLTEEDKKGFKF